MQTTIVKDSCGTREVSVDAVMNGKRVMFLTGDIDYGTALYFVQQIMFFAQEDITKPVKVFISSNGGAIEAGMVIYDAIRTTKLPLEMYCIGRAYSMAAVILAAGKHGRYILPHSRVMIHEPGADFQLQAKTSSLRAASEMMMSVKNEMDKIIAELTGHEVEEITEITTKDRYYTAEEAVEFGFVDAVKGLDEMLEGTA